MIGLDNKSLQTHINSSHIISFHLNIQTHLNIELVWLFVNYIEFLRKRMKSNIVKEFLVEGFKNQFKALGPKRIENWID